MNPPDRTEAKRRQAEDLAAQIDAVAESLERDGLVSAAELQRRLQELEAEWAAPAAQSTPSREAAPNAEIGLPRATGKLSANLSRRIPRTRSDSFTGLSANSAPLPPGAHVTAFLHASR